MYKKFDLVSSSCNPLYYGTQARRGRVWYVGNGMFLRYVANTSAAREHSGRRGKQCEQRHGLMGLLLLYCSFTRVKKVTNKQRVKSGYKPGCIVWQD